MRTLPTLTSIKQRGFTLIELVIVIVIIGILAAVAIPNFGDMSGDANKSAANATAANLASWTTSNYARCAGKLTGSVANVGCDAAGMTAAGLTGTTSGSNAACVVTVNSVASNPVVTKQSAASCT